MATDSDRQYAALTLLQLRIHQARAHHPPTPTDELRIAAAAGGARHYNVPEETIRRYLATVTAERVS